MYSKLFLYYFFLVLKNKGDLLIKARRHFIYKRKVVQNDKGAFPNIPVMWKYNVSDINVYFQNRR